jgi:uncharacterized protein
MGGASRFIWYELMSPDPHGAKAFYDAVVGWDIEAEPASALDYRMIRRGDGGHAGGLLRLTDEMAAGGARPCWLAYVGVADVDAAAAAMQADGATVQMPAMDMPGVGRMAMLGDPHGAPFYIMTPAPGQAEAVSDVFSVDRPQHVRWNELWAGDPAEAVAFYRRHFGWTQEGSMPMGEMGDYLFIQSDGVGIGAIMPRMPDVPHPMWNFYFGVDDIDRAAAAVRAGGGTVFQEPMQIPGGEYSLNGSDPQGAMFGLVGPRNA